MEELNAQRRNQFVLKGLLSYPLSGYHISGLPSNFLKLLTDYRSVEATDGDACLAVVLDAGGLPRRSLSEGG